MAKSPAVTFYSQVDRPPAKKKVCPKSEGKTRQAEKDACDINRIMARYEKTGVLPQSVRELVYADVSSIGDYREVVDRVRMVESAFMQLPAEVRSRFENDPAAFLDFTSDPANRAELQEMGLIAPEIAPEASKPAAGSGTPAEEETS